MAADNASLPDPTSLCFHVKVIPTNSIIYTELRHRTVKINFNYCDAVFSANETIEESYIIGYD